MSDQCYELLGCSVTDSDSAIRQSFRARALAAHPDKQQAGTVTAKAAAETFKQLHNAYEGVMQARAKLAKTAEALSPATAFRELYGEPGTQSSFAQSSLSSSFAHTTTSFGPSCSGPRPGTLGLDSRTSSGGLSSGLSSMASGSSRFASPRTSASTLDCCSTATATASTLAGVKRPIPQQQQQQQRPVEQVLTLSLEELYSGCTKRMLLKRRVFDEASGSGRHVQEVLEVAVAPGWREGTRVTFRGKGDYHPGSAPADLVFVVREELHPQYERRGNDLITRVSVPLVTALTGGEVELSLLDRRKMRLPISDVITPNCERIVEGEGMPIARSPGQRGNLVVKFDLMFPKALSPLQKCLVRTAFAEPEPEHTSTVHTTVIDIDDCSEAPMQAMDMLDESLASTAVVAARAIIMSVLQGSVRNSSLRLLTG